MRTQLVQLWNRASVLQLRTIRPFNAAPKRHFLRCSTIPRSVLRVPLSTTSIQKIELPDVPRPLHERLATAVGQLIGERRYQPGDRLPTHRVLAQQAGVAIGPVTKALDLLSARGILRGEVGRGTFVNDVRIAPVHDGIIDLSVNGPPQVIPERSEEHTSELHYLMRNSYAVFCLKKKT